MSGATTAREPATNPKSDADGWPESYRRWLARQILLTALGRESADMRLAVEHREAIVTGCVALADELITQTSRPGERITLWFRPSGHARWDSVGTVATPLEALQMIGVGGRRHGDWLSLPANRNPNMDHATR